MVLATPSSLLPLLTEVSGRTTLAAAPWPITSSGWARAAEQRSRKQPAPTANRTSLSLYSGRQIWQCHRREELQRHLHPQRLGRHGRDPHRAQSSGAASRRWAASVPPFSTRAGGTNNFNGGGLQGLGTVGSTGSWDNYEGALFLGYDGNSNATTQGKAPSMGTYNLSGGVLYGGGSSNGRSDEYIGFSGTGVFNQTGGINTCNGVLDIGGCSQSLYTSKSTGNGTYNLSKGLLSASPMGEYLGDTGSGLINQTGGTNSTYTVTLGGGVSGAYNLNGGLLQTNAINDAGGAIFTFTAGTLQAGPGWYPTASWALPINVTGTSPARIDMNGQQVSITSLAINSSLVDLNFADPTTGNDLLTVGGLTVNDPVAISFGTNPTVAGSYPLSAAAWCDCLGHAGATWRRFSPFPRLRQA